MSETVDPKAKKKKPPKHEVVFHTYPKLIYIWPLIVAGVLFWPMAGWPGFPEVLGWIYLVVAALVILSIGVDLERNHAVFWLAVILGFYFFGRWLQDAKHFTLFGDIFRWFAGLDVAYDAGFGLALSILMAIPYVLTLVWARIQHRWRITHNEFEHYAWGRADDSLARGAKRVRSTYPDLIELLLCGAGTLIVYSATGRSELRRIPNVPLIFLVRKRINRLLETTAITRPDADAVEEDDENEEAEASGRAEGGQSAGPTEDPL